MLLQRGVELAQFHIGHSPGMGEVDVRGRDLGDRHVAVIFTAGIESRQLFTRPRGLNRNDQADHHETRNAHGSLLRQIRAEEINRERRPFARLCMHV